MVSDNGHHLTTCLHHTFESAQCQNEQRGQDNCQLQQQPEVTIVTLPDDVLLKIFESFVNATGIDGFASDEWHTLVHVCQRWRCLAFTCPRHLNLQLVCKIPRRSVEALKETLDIWPELPISVQATGRFMYGERRDWIAALRLNHRVSGIRLEKVSGSELVLEKFLLSQMERSFPALTYLKVRMEYSIENAIKNSFLGGSAPSLRDLLLALFPFPALPELLLSTTNLVRLWYDDIPRAGYISPQELVTALSGLTQLESLSITFLSELQFVDIQIRVPPPHTRALLPALTNLRFRSGPEYMEDFVAQIDTPLLESMMVTSFRQRKVLEFSQLAKFICRAEKLSLLNQAKVMFRGGSGCITLNLSQELHIIDHKSLMLNLSCCEWDLQLSFFAQFCASCLPSLPSFERVLIHVPTRYKWEGVIDDPDPQWLELLRPLNTVKDLRLSKHVAPRIAQVLRRLPVERVSEVLPALETIFIAGLEPFGPVKEAISEFADARQLSGQSVSICDWKEQGHNTFEDLHHMYV